MANYFANAKKEPAVLNAPGLTDNPLLVTDPNISIAQLLDLARKFFSDVLPESVLRHYGYDARPDGKLGQSALYSSAITPYDDLRAENEELREKLADYKKTLKALEKAQNKADYWKGQTKRTTEKSVRQSDSDRIAKSLIKTYSSKIKTADISERMRSLGNYLVRGYEGDKALTWEDAKNKAIDQYDTPKIAYRSTKILLMSDRPSVSGRVCRPGHVFPVSGPPLLVAAIDALGPLPVGMVRYAAAFLAVAERAVEVCDIHLIAQVIAPAPAAGLYRSRAAVRQIIAVITAADGLEFIQRELPAVLPAALFDLLPQLRGLFLRDLPSVCRQQSGHFTYVLRREELCLEFVRHSHHRCLSFPSVERYTIFSGSFKSDCIRL